MLAKISHCMVLLSEVIHYLKFFSLSLSLLCLSNRWVLTIVMIPVTMACQIYPMDLLSEDLVSMATMMILMT